MDRREEGNVVKDYYIGNTHIQICDDYCRNQTPEEAQKIINEIVMMGVRCRRAAAIKDMETTTED